KPCLDYLIGKCSGHCFKKIEPEYYQKIKQGVIKFFQGKVQRVKKELQKSLQKSIARQEFELAKREKKILDNLIFFTSEQSVAILSLSILPKKSFPTSALSATKNRRPRTFSPGTRIFFTSASPRKKKENSRTCSTKRSTSLTKKFY